MRPMAVALVHPASEGDATGLSRMRQRTARMPTLTTATTTNTTARSAQSALASASANASHSTPRAVHAMAATEIATPIHVLHRFTSGSGSREEGGDHVGEVRCG